MKLLILTILIHLFSLQLWAGGQTVGNGGSSSSEIIWCYNMDKPVLFIRANSFSDKGLAEVVRVESSPSESQTVILHISFTREQDSQNLVQNIQIIASGYTVLIKIPFKDDHGDGIITELGQGTVFECTKTQKYGN